MTFERAFDVALGASAATWAVMRVVSAPPGERFAAATMTVALLNLCVAILFVVRAPAVAGTSPRAVVASLPSVVAAGIALRLAPAPLAWPLDAEIAFAIGGAVTVVSLATLGRSFAVFPSLRAVITRGPYRLVRHPAYVGELTMIAGCSAARGDALALAVGVAALGAVAARVVAEERVLARDEAWAAYATRVRWRIVPGIW